MHVLLVIVGVHAVLLGFGFLVAGWGSLIGPNEQELADLKVRLETARKTSWLQVQLAAFKWRREFGSNKTLFAHWHDRPQARKFIYLGAVFLAVAGVVGYFTGALD